MWHSETLHADDYRSGTEPERSIKEVFRRLDEAFLDFRGGQDPACEHCCDEGQEENYIEDVDDDANCL